MMAAHSIRSAAEALASRYRNESWYINVQFASGIIQLNVKSDCLIHKHRPVMGYPVVICQKAPNPRITP